MPGLYRDPELETSPKAPALVQRGEQSEGSGASLGVAGRPGSPIGISQVLGLQRSAGNRATAVWLQREEDDAVGDAAGGTQSPVHEAIGRGGEPIDAPTRQAMEPVLNTSLSDVQLVKDRRSTESVDASAYTVGNKVVVNPDRFQSGTPQAQRTLFHELTHVKQQREGPVAGTPQAGGIQVSHPSDRFELEAEHTADQMTSHLQREAEEGVGT